MKDLVLGNWVKGLDNTRVILSVDSFPIDFHKNSDVANIKYIIPSREERMTFISWFCKRPISVKMYSVTFRYYIFRGIEWENVLVPSTGTWLIKKNKNEKNV